MTVKAFQWQERLDMSGLNRAELRSGLTELRACHAEAIAATMADRERWRSDLIAARRRMPVIIGKLSEIVSAAGNVDEACSLRNALNEMRHKLALHQANWPAVRINLTDKEYLSSLENLQRANKEFIELAERILVL